jgi:hypothetical protein
MLFALQIGVVLRHAAAVFWADGSRDARSVPFVLVHDQVMSLWDATQPLDNIILVVLSRIHQCSCVHFLCL